MSDLLETTLHDRVALLRFDDGKANAISHQSLAALNEALDHAEKEADAAVLLGRPGRFSAGFDLSVMTEGPEAARQLVAGGAQLALRMAEAPIPIVAACSGHALAMGALLLLAADLRVGARGSFKLGLNEVAIRMTLPDFAIELARERLSRRHLGPATVLAEIVDPDRATDVGWLDRVVAPEALEATALEEAARLGELPRRAFSETKRALRADMLGRIRASLEGLATWGAS
jgi:enoyl-CoA hydratase